MSRNVARDSKLTSAERRHAAGDRLGFDAGGRSTRSARSFAPRERYAVDVPPAPRAVHHPRRGRPRLRAFYFLPAIQVRQAERVFRYGSGESRRPARRERAHVLRRAGHASVARGRAVMARAPLTVRPRVPVRARPHGDPRRAPRARARELRLACARARHVCFGRVGCLAPERDRASGLDAAALDGGRPARRRACGAPRGVRARVRGRAAEPLRRLGDLGAEGARAVRVRLGGSRGVRRQRVPLREPRLPPAAALARGVDFRAMGAFDTRLLHLQFLLFLVAALPRSAPPRATASPAAPLAHALSRSRSRPPCSTSSSPRTPISRSRSSSPSASPPPAAGWSRTSAGRWRSRRSASPARC